MLLFTPSTLSSPYHIALSPLFLIAFPSSSATLQSEKKDNMHTRPNARNTRRFRIAERNLLIKIKRSKLNSVHIRVHKVLTEMCVKMTAGEFLHLQHQIFCIILLKLEEYNGFIIITLGGKSTFLYAVKPESFSAMILHTTAQ